MKTLIGSTALVLVLALPAMAQDSTAPATTTDPAATAPAMTDPATGAMAEAPAMTSPYLEGVDTGVRASDFIGKRVYVTEADVASMPRDAMADASTDWEDAGEISDLIISMNGDSEAVLVDFGGFLGIGEKTVAVSMSNLVMVPDADSPDDYFIVFQGNRTALEAAPAFNPDMVFEADNAAMTTEGGLSDTATGTMTTDGTAVAPAAGTDAATDMGGDPVDYAVMTEGDLIGKRVYGPNDEDVGEISAVTLGADNAITAAVIDVGGFLGIGEKPVALGADQLRMIPEADGTGASFRVALTQEQLEALPTYTN